MSTARTYTLKALTDIWTGSVRLEEKDSRLREQIVPDRLITTGLFGSIRWWFEVVVRGLGGSACDPTQDGNRCPASRKEPREPGHHCVVCELFGCTGWARKFRFDVLNGDGKAQWGQIKANQDFQLCFTPLRPICDEEWALLDITIRLIADYGAIGGKTVLKPSDEPNRQTAFHHKDFGLIKLETVGPVAPVRKEQQLRQYVNHSSWRCVGHDEFAWASLLNFWCVKGRYLARQDSNTSNFNRVLGRPQPKTQAGRNDSWLAGRRASQGGGPESKKVFSFKDPESARRTFGFVKPGTVDFQGIKGRVKTAWSDLRDDEFVTGAEIFRRLLGQGGKV